MNSINFDNKLARKGLLRSAVLTAILMTPLSSHAIDLKPHKAGNFDVTALMTSTLGYGDNVFRGSINEQSSSFFTFSPVVRATKDDSKQSLTFEYEGEGAAFFDSSGDNFLSTRLGGEYLRKLTPTSDFGVGLAYEDGNNIRGTDITEGSESEFEGATEFTRTDFNLDYRIGSQKIGPSLTLGYLATDLEFDNFEQINRGRDYSLDKLSARLGYQYSVATSFFIDLSTSDFDYDASVTSLNGDLDGSEKTVMVGVKWRVSRRTSGEVSVGSTDKEFDNFNDPSSLTTWNAEIEWTPSARDTILLTSFSRPYEQAGTGLFQDVEQTSLSWERDLNRSLSFRSGLKVGSVSFDTTAREDDIESLELGLIYKPSKYSEVSLNYEYEDKESNFTRFDYNSSTVFVSYSISL